MEPEGVDGKQLKLASCMLMYKDEQGKKATTLVVHHMTDEYPFFIRGSIQQACLFISRVVVERTEVDNHQTITVDGDGEFKTNQILENYVCHVYVQGNGLAATTVTSRDYPARIAFGMMINILNKFQEVKPDWKETLKPGKDQKLKFHYMINTCKKYENPAKDDKILQIEEQVNQTSEVMQKNISALLERGEKIQSLIDKTEDLESQSKVFLKSADKVNSCWQRCNIM